MSWTLLEFLLPGATAVARVALVLLFVAYVSFEVGRELFLTWKGKRS